MEEKLLSIGIPTYNGCDSLKKNLENIIKILKEFKLEEKINIVVSDNCSTDQTESVCRVYGNLDNFFYFKNNENIGYDRNVDNVINKSNSDYVWLLSDDDTINHRINEIYKILEDTKPQYMFVNFENEIVLDSGDENVLYAEYTDINDFFENEKFKNGLISSNIVKSSCWKSYEMSKYFDKYWIHFAYLINVFVQEKNIKTNIFYPYALVQHLTDKNNRGNWYNSDKNLLIHIKLLEILYELNFCNATKNTLKNARNVILGGYPKGIIQTRLNGHNIQKSILSEYKKYVSFTEFVKLYIYCHIPLKLIKILIKIRRGLYDR